jgi:predicted small lipoprotein YifL
MLCYHFLFSTFAPWRDFIMHRLFIALAITLTVSACGIRGSLEKPTSPVPPSLYERAFGQQDSQNATSAPLQQDGKQPDDANTAENRPE